MKKKSGLYFIAIILIIAISAVISACGKVGLKLNFIVDGEVYATIDTNGGETIHIPDDSIKENAEFDGWYWDEGTWTRPFTANSLLETPITSNISVYAKFRTEGEVNDTELRLKGFTLVETESRGKGYYISLPNGQTIYDVGAVVTIDSLSAWSLSTDLYGDQTIAGKRVELSVGDNIFYTCRKSLSSIGAIYCFAPTPPIIYGFLCYGRRDLVRSAGIGRRKIGDCA